MEILLDLTCSASNSRLLPWTVLARESRTYPVPAGWSSSIAAHAVILSLLNLRSYGSWCISMKICMLRFVMSGSNVDAILRGHAAAKLGLVSEEVKTKVIRLIQMMFGVVWMTLHSFKSVGWVVFCKHMQVVGVTELIHLLNICFRLTRHSLEWIENDRWSVDVRLRWQLSDLMLHWVGGSILVSICRSPWSGNFLFNHFNQFLISFAQSLVVALNFLAQISLSCKYLL